MDYEVRILPVWENRTGLANVYSARMVVLIGFPVEQIEEYPLDIHRINVKSSN